jgi:D-alanyl-D-alanine carboxypeptidase
VTRVAATRTDTVATAPAAPATPAPGSVEPIRPRPVKVFVVGKTGEPATTTGTLGVLPGNSLMAPTQVAAQPLQIAPAPAVPAPIAAPTPTAPQVVPAPQPAPVASVTISPAPAVPAPAAPRIRSGWQIQIGAFPEERQARERIDQARTRFGTLLAKTEPYTEKTQKGATTLFRARFAGLDEDGARRACALLKKGDFVCMAFKN